MENMEDGQNTGVATFAIWGLVWVTALLCLLH
jgi:hypothetical protein